MTLTDQYDWNDRYYSTTVASKNQIVSEILVSTIADCLNVPEDTMGTALGLGCWKLRRVVHGGPLAIAIAIAIVLPFVAIHSSFII